MSSKRKSTSSTGNKKGGKKRNNNGQEDVIDLCDSSDDDDYIIKLPSPSQPQPQPTSSSSFLSSSATIAMPMHKGKRSKLIRKYKIFCDLDGVLVDFDKGATALFHNRYKSTSAIPSHVLWPRINSSSNFFRDLSWTKDGVDLWKVLVELYCHHEHIETLSILTGCPRNHSSKSQKFEWCQRHLQHTDFSSTNMKDNNNNDRGIMKLKLVHVDKAAKKSRHEIVHNKNANPSGMKSLKSMFQPKSNSSASSNTSSQPKSHQSSSTNTMAKSPPSIQKRIDVITCWSKNKHYESKRNHVLIDDRLKLKDDWTSKGGIFIHHTNTKDTIRQLKECGIMGS